MGSGFPIGKLCLLFGLSRQAWYEHNWRRERELLEEAVVVEIIRAVRSIAGLKKAGVRTLQPLMAPELVRHGIKIGRDGILAIMVRHGLYWRRKPFRPRTTFSGGYLPLFPDLAKDMVPDAPEQLWVSDITYLWVDGRWCYLSLVTDAYSHRIMGFFLSDSLSAEGCIAALEMALANRLYPATQLTHHSDRGLQYRCQGYLELLRGVGTPLGDKPLIASSMTQSGDPLENAMAERVNGILKVDMGLADETYSSLAEATAAVTAVVATYNNLRGHASIDRMPPAAAHLISGPIRNLWKGKECKK